jgi:predicted ATPase
MAIHIRKLDLRNWRNFQKGAITISNRLFLIGPNAAGKSNLLDAFKFLRDISTAKGGGFQQAIDIRGGISSIRSLSSRRNPDIQLQVELEDDNSGSSKVTWTYTLSFTQDNNRRPIIRSEIVTKNGHELLKRPSKSDDQDPARLTQTALEQINENRDFREIASTFQTVSYMHILPQLVRDPQSFSPRAITNDPYGRDFLQRVVNTPSQTKDSRLKKILSALKVAAPQLKDLRVERDVRGIPHLVGLFEHWRPNAGHQRETEFSDGTLRFFALLWSLFEGDGLLLMEEPELSLHSEIVRQLPQLIEQVHRARKIRRQVIISTHSEEMLLDSGLSAEEVVWLEPSSEGTILRAASEDKEIVEQLRTGLTVADVVFPRSIPKKARQLPLLFR